MDENLQKLIQEIKANWAKVTGGYPDPNYWDQAVQSAFPPYTVINWTDDFNYSKSYTYEVIAQVGKFAQPGSAAQEQALIRQLGGHKYSLLLKLSIVLPYYLTRFLERTLDDKGQIVEKDVTPQTDEQRRILDRANQFAQKQGFKPIPPDYLNVLVPDVELELADPGTVTVYNCLFEDQSN